MCIQYPEIIITSPTEPAVFCAVPETIQENLLTTNYEQWCALYSMNEDDISLAFVSNNLKEQRKQNYEEQEKYEYDEEYEYEYGEEYKYEYDEIEDDGDFYDEYQQSSKRQTLSDEFNNYNETHSQKYEGYDNSEYNCYYDDENNGYDEGFDYEYDYESDRNYNDVEDDYYMEKKPNNSSSKPRLNYGILANAINRRFNKTTDSDFSEEEEIDEFETETVETKVVIKNVPSFKVTHEVPNSESDLFQESMDICSDDEESYDYMEAVTNKFRQKKDSSKIQLKSSISYENEFFNDPSFGKLEAISNSHGGRSTFPNIESNSYQNYIFKNIMNNNKLCSIDEECGIIQIEPMKNRKKGFSLNGWDDFISWF